MSCEREIVQLYWYYSPWKHAAVARYLNSHQVKSQKPHPLKAEAFCGKLTCQEICWWRPPFLVPGHFRSSFITSEQLSKNFPVLFALASRVPKLPTPFPAPPEQRSMENSATKRENKTAFFLCPRQTNRPTDKRCTGCLLPFCSTLLPAAPHTHGNSEHTQRLKDNTLTAYGQNWICYSKLYLEQGAGEQIVIVKMHSEKPPLSHMARKGLQLITDTWGKLCWTEASRLLYCK